MPFKRCFQIIAGLAIHVALPTLARSKFLRFERRRPDNQHAGIGQRISNIFEKLVFLSLRDVLEHIQRESRIEESL